ATTNAGLLYTAKGTAALLVPYSNQLQQITGSWGTVFIIAAAANIAAALLAIGVLRPWRNHVIRRVDEEGAAAGGRMGVAHASQRRWAGSACAGVRWVT